MITLLKVQQARYCLCLPVLGVDLPGLGLKRRQFVPVGVALLDVPVEAGYVTVPEPDI